MADEIQVADGAEAPEQHDVADVQTTEAPQIQPDVSPAVNIPLNEMGDYGKDYIPMMSDAKAGRDFKKAGGPDLMAAMQESGLSPADLAGYLRQGDTGEQPAMQTGGEDGVEQQPDLSLDAIGELIDRRFQAENQRATENVARQTEQQEGMKALGELGIKADDDGQPTFQMKQAWQMWNAAGNEALEASLSPYLSADQKADAVNQPLTGEALANASTIFKQNWQDLENEMASSAVAKQQDIPGATHAAGAPGSPPRRSRDDMTAKEFAADVMESVMAQHG